VQQIAGLGCYKNRLAVFGDKHALRLRAGRHLVHDRVALHVDHGERGALLLGDVEAAAFLVDAEGLGAWPGLEPADHIELRHVHNVDHVVGAAGDVEL
jgi:hypothetical protein